MKRITAIALTLLALGTVARAEERFAILQPKEMNPAQKNLYDTIVAGPRAQNYGGEAAQRVLTGGPFNAWLRSPDLASMSASGARSRVGSTSWRS
jgi:hypothetical protein